MMIEKSQTVLYSISFYFFRVNAESPLKVDCRLTSHIIKIKKGCIFCTWKNAYPPQASERKKILIPEHDSAEFFASAQLLACRAKPR